MATLAAAGVTVFAASGDEGSNPTPGGSGGYSASEPLAVDYPASDPSVTGVGGTTLTFTGDWNYGGDVVWNEIASQQSASGGGVSGQFPKPSWQTGGAVLAGQSMRCVPDVAALSNSNLMNVNLGSGFLPENASGVGVLVYVNGQPEALGGTSLACPIWAAIGALINQERATEGAATHRAPEPAPLPAFRKRVLQRRHERNERRLQRRAGLRSLLRPRALPMSSR